ncbi:MAG TPA: glycosyltransferase family 2 protein [Candidatus Nanoarchaeia archaeon]|nr:glycosyltransferase family 2 protein [Candidatus Nanoarchaeia archaeon]
MYKKLKVALVIPAHNEERLIVPTLENVPKTIDKVYVMDDASTDKTAEIVKNWKDKRVELVKFHDKKNPRGPGHGIIAGYQKASRYGYDAVVVIGGDNQMDLADLPNFLEPFVKDEADYVKGNRFLGVNASAFNVMPGKRFFGNSMLSFMTKFASGYWGIFDTQDGYTAISKKAIDLIDWKEVWGGYGYVSDFLVVFNRYNLRVKDVPRRAIYLPGERQSQIKIGKYIRRMAPLLIKRFFWRLKNKYLFQEFHPLVFFYFFGILFIPIGIILGIRALYFAIISTAPTNETILSALFIITGLQFFLFAMLFDMQANAKLQK